MAVALQQQSTSPEEAARFLQALGGTDARWYFQTFDDGDRKSKHLARQFYGTLDEHFETMAEINRQGAGVFATINETDGAGRCAKNITQVRALFVDLDGTLLDASRYDREDLPPTAIVESSPGRYHLYWRCEGCPLEDFKPMQEALARRFQGDPKVKDLPRVMRLPGFDHLKNEPFQSRIIETTGATYRYEEIRHFMSAWLAAAQDVPSPSPKVNSAGGRGYFERAISEEAAEVANAQVGSRNATLNRAAYKLAGISGMPEDEARAELLAAALSSGLSEAEAQQTIRSGWAGGREKPRALRPGTRQAAHPRRDAAPDVAAVGEASTGKPVIQIVSGQRAEAVEQMRQALRDDPASRFFTRQGAIVRTVRHEEITTGPVRRPVGALTIEPVNKNQIVAYLDQLALFEKFNAKKESRPVDCPPQHAEQLLSLPEQTGLPELRTLARCPVLTLDGRRLPHGYDAATGILIDAPGDWPPLPKTLTRDDAQKAVSCLKNFLRNFPFDDDISQAAALALFITAPMRAVLPACPGFFVDAPCYGAGKSLLVDAAAIVATGKPSPVVAYSREPAEFEKRLDGTLLAGDPFICIDNVDGVFKSDALCQTLTQEARRIRPLGGSQMVSVPCTAMVTATGKNARPYADLVRRLIVIRIVPDMERPEHRRIEQDLLAEAEARRGELLHAAQVVVKAYQDAGCPSQDAAPIGSFGVWARHIRDALLWAGEADAALSMETLRQDDPEVTTRAAILEAIHELQGDRPFIPKGVLMQANTEHPTEAHRNLKDALEGIPTPRDLDSRTLGNWLRYNLEQPTGGYVLKKSKQGEHRIALPDGTTGRTQNSWQVLKMR